MTTRVQRRSKAVRLVRQRIAAAKAHRARNDREIARFVEGLTRVGATVMLYEADLFGSYTPPARCRRKKGKR